MPYLAYLVIGLIVGCVSGIMGIGGGVLLVPALIWICGFDPRMAAGTSLAILIPPIGLPAALRAYHDHHVHLTAAVWIAVAFMLGAYVSRGVVEFIPDTYFRWGMGIIMIFIAIRLIMGPSIDTRSSTAGVLMFAIFGPYG